jgi:hypothetical protein
VRRTVRTGRVEAGSELNENKEHAIAMIRLHQNTTVTPEQFLAGLTGFGPGRSKLFANSAADRNRHDSGRRLGW